MLCVSLFPLDLIELLVTIVKLQCSCVLPVYWSAKITRFSIVFLIQKILFDVFMKLFWAFDENFHSFWCTLSTGYCYDIILINSLTLYHLLKWKHYKESLLVQDQGYCQPNNGALDLFYSGYWLYSTFLLWKKIKLMCISLWFSVIDIGVKMIWSTFWHRECNFSIYMYYFYTVKFFLYEKY